MIRTGLFIRHLLLQRGEECIAEMHRALKGQIAMENQRRPRWRGLRGPTYSSFLKYLHNLARLGLVEFSGREEPLEMVSTDDLLQIRMHGRGTVVPSVKRYFRITPKGIREIEPWENPIRALGHQRRIADLFK